MFGYLCYFLVFLLLFISLSFSCNSTKIKFVIFFWILILSVLVGISNENIGADHSTYIKFYKSVPDIFNAFPNHTRIEIGSYLSACILKTFSLSWCWWYFFNSFLVLSCVLYASKKLLSESYWYYLPFYFSFFFFQNHFNVVRHGIMASLVFLSFAYAYERKLYAYLLFIGLAMSFHRLAIFFIPTYWIVNHKFSLVESLVILVVSFLCGNLLFKSIVGLGFFESQIDYYLNIWNKTHKIDTSLTSGTYLYILVYFLSYYLRDLNFDDKFSYIRNLFLCCLCVRLIFVGTGVFSERISNVYNYSLGLLWIYSFRTNVVDNKIVKLLFYIYICCILYVNVLCSNPFGRTGYQFYPYKTIYE